MEFVNEYIDIEITESSELGSSFCSVTNESSSLNLRFGLNTNDCLFDLSEINYLVSIYISKRYFSKYQDQFNIADGRDTICCNIQSKLLDLITTSLTGINRKIFLESNILFLLYQLEKNRMGYQLDCDGCTILKKPLDKEKIQMAQKYIIENLSNTLTIPIIASHVGTNLCYLKKGFKEVFNQTIFEFIQENRMVKAKHLLINGELSITEISQSVGYASLSSFSQSYKNFFGISPMDQRKTIYS